MHGNWAYRGLHLLLLSAAFSTAESLIKTTVISMSTAEKVSMRTSSSPTGVSTCQSVSVNYVSPGLPQQCLRTRVVSTDKISINGTGATPPPTALATVDVSATPIATRPVPTSPLERPSTSIPPNRPSNSSEAPSPSQKEPDNEESPLDTAKFLSFEEWKAQNLAKAGQSKESFEGRGVREPRGKAPGSGSSTLDSLGDELEIDLGGGSSDSREKAIEISAQDPKPSRRPGTVLRSKDAGKTCKERFNYASFDCAATVHKTNKEAKSGNSILVENKETYMLNKCEAKEKFFIVELCGDILVDTVVLANFEFFSSVFKEIQVSASDRYPVKSNGWRTLGTFVAKNTRDVQAFLVETPLIWARYIKVELLSHYGNEYYCPLSLFRVHGTTMMEEFRHQEEAARGYIADDVREDVTPEAVAEEVKKTQSQLGVDSPRKPVEKNASSTSVGAVPRIMASSALNPVPGPPNPSVAVDPHMHYLSRNERLVFASSLPVCPINMHTYLAISAGSAARLRSSASTSFIGTLSHSRKPAPPDSSMHQDLAAPSSTPSASRAQSPSPPPSGKIPSSPVQEKPAQAQPPTASPTTQESFFKSVHKRLLQLERNSTLSLQYIEEQSRLLRDAFAKMERKQISKVEQLLDKLNATAFTDLKNYRDKYDQLWQSTIIALESQREHSEREMVEISSRLSLLADEVIFQKRMYQLNTILLLITIGVVIFSRNSTVGMPLVHHLRTRSSMRIFESPPNSPPLRSAHSPQPRHRSNSSDSASSLNSPNINYSPPTPSTYVSREPSPVILETQSSPFTPSVTRKGSRRGWVHFGPQLHPESRGKRWQRLPSPLGGTVDDEGDEIIVHSERDAAILDGEPGNAVNAVYGNSYPG